jgi:hypothetical protein
MKEATVEQALAIGGIGRHDAEAGPADGRRTMWRIAERVLSVTIAGAALSGAIYLGVTGPLTSPVSPAPAPAQAAVTGGTGAASVPATDDVHAGGGPGVGDPGRGDTGGRGRR